MKVLQMVTDETGETECSTNGFALACSLDWERANLKPNTTYVCVMIELPAGYRLVTDAEREQNPKLPTAYKVICDISLGFLRGHDIGGVMYPDRLYAVPTDFTFNPIVELTIDGKTIQLSADSIKAIQEIAK